MAEGIRQKCDFCNETAIYDGKTKFGPWGFMCARHFEQHGIQTEGLFTRLQPAPELQATKRCRICGEEKPLSDFYQYTDTVGVTRFRTECITCNSAIRRINYRKGDRKHE